MLGEVRVNAGQTLSVEATGTYAQIDNIPVNTEPEEYPLSNYGVIKVLGTVRRGPKSNSTAINVTCHFPPTSPGPS